ncbi:MAG: transglycosylase domain-containing protein, partial [Cyclobacteriaceae bacterium]|nr:transglycosylase domain-containing protein [Cyclobacteriaceae bacterium]
HLIEALVATEDVRFFEHQGVDFWSLFRVAFKTVLLQDQSSGGGSTITQQLAKNIFPRTGNGRFSLPISKVKEMVIAGRIEQVYSKSEILALYLNTVSFGYNSYGIETASRRFFNKSPERLSIQESAMLVGMLKATTLYNPHRNPELAIDRRNVVISQMAKYEFIKAVEGDSLKLLPMELDFTPSSHNEGLATYFREFLRAEVQKWAQEKNHIDGSSINLYTDGLKIYTTLNSKLQRYAEQAVSQHLAELQKTFNDHWGNTRPWYKHPRTLLNAIRKTPRYRQLKAQGLSEADIQANFKQPYTMKVFTWDGEKEVEMSPLDSVKHYLYFLNAGFMAMDPDNGSVLAWVGGINHKYFKYDHVNAETQRQVGSIFKPIVYAAALESGVRPCDFVSSKRITYTNFDDWSPGNADENYDGFYSVQGALTHSVNTVSVKVLKRTRIDRAVTMAQRMGIENEIPQVPSIALGTPNLSLYEMVGAFGTFAREGYTVKPQYLGKIVNSKGELLEQFYQDSSRNRAMSRHTATTMVQMMKNVVDKGTAQRIRSKYKLKNDVAGKTGTTQSHADGWFIGVTPKLVAGAWVGSDDPNIHFRTITYGQGAAMALPIWAVFMQKVNEDDQFNDIEAARFPLASAEIMKSLDCVDYKEQRDLYHIFQKILGDRKKRPPRQRRKKAKK